MILPNDYYRFQSYSDGKYLNVYTSSTVTNNKNVTTYTLDTSDNCQIWKCEVYSSDAMFLKSKQNESFVLDRYRGASNYNNADVYTKATTSRDRNDQLITLVSATQGYYRIKLVSADLYLTVTSASTTGGHNVKWQANTGNSDQLWLPHLYTSSGNSEPSLIEGSRPSDLNYSSSNYDSSNVNPFPQGQCTWHAWGRMKEVTGNGITFSQSSGRHAKYWPSLVTNCTLYTTPVEHSVAVWDNGGAYGHVGFIEKIDGSTIYITEANWPGDDMLSDDDGQVKKLTTTSISARGINGTYIIQNYIVPNS